MNLYIELLKSYSLHAYVYFTVYQSYLNKAVKKNFFNPTKTTLGPNGITDFFFFFFRAGLVAYGSSQPGMESKLQLPAYITATAAPVSYIHSSLKSGTSQSKGKKPLTQDPR